MKRCSVGGSKSREILRGEVAPGAVPKRVSHVVSSLVRKVTIRKLNRGGRKCAQSSDTSKLSCEPGLWMCFMGV